MVVAASGKDPELAVSWKSFQIKMDYKKLLDPLLLLLGVFTSLEDSDEDSEDEDGERSRNHSVLLSIEFDDFKSSSPNTDFDFFIGPGSKTPSSPASKEKDIKTVPRPLRWTIGKLVKRFVQHALLFVEIKFRAFNFDWNMPVDECDIKGGCDTMTIYFPRDKKSSRRDKRHEETMTDFFRGETVILHDLECIQLVVKIRQGRYTISPLLKLFSP